MEKIVNCKRLIGSLKRLLYAEDIRSLEETKLIYTLEEFYEYTNKK